MKGGGGSPDPKAKSSALAAPGAAENDLFNQKGYTDTLA